MTNNELSKALKVIPPFPRLPVFNVAALILSYINFNDEVISLLNTLSKNAYVYGKSHQDILKSFLVQYKPKITRVLSFGIDYLPWDTVWPPEDYLETLPRYQKIRLKTIRIKQVFNMLNLAGIQFVFTHGHVSPWL